MEPLVRIAEPRCTESCSELVELKAGGPYNLFLVHDGDGYTGIYQDLAKRMPSDLSVLGIAPSAIRGVPLAHARIEDMAQSYIAEIRRRQPHGPYLLGGLCAGGVIAYEMASQLLSMGEPVEPVILLEAATPQTTEQRGHIATQRLGRIKQEVARLTKTNQSRIGQAYAILAVSSHKLLNAIAWEMADRGERLWVRVRFGLLRHLLARQIPWPWYIPELSTRQIYVSAHDRYRPKPLCGGALVVVRARHRTPAFSDTPYSMLYSDETLGWGKLAKDIAFVDVDGGHSTMLQEPFVKSLAERLVLHLRPKVANQTSKIV